MAKFYEILEFLNTSILSTVDDTVNVSKTSLSNIQTYLQNALNKFDFLQLESQLQQAELQQWTHHYELVYVQKIGIDSHKKQVNNDVFDSDLVLNEGANLYADAEAHASPPKPIIRTCEEIVHQKHIISI